MNTNQKVSRNFYNAAIREAESCIGKDVGNLSEELYTEFARNGNRVNYESVCFDRRRLLNRLAIGEICEESGRFLPELTRLIDCTLNEPTWVLPAHSGGKLPEAEETNIDLFSCNTASALAMISARLPLEHTLQKRIWEAIDARIFQPFLKYDYWWRDLGENRRKVPSNWTPWCIHGVLECVRAILPDVLPWCDKKFAQEGFLEPRTWYTKGKYFPLEDASARELAKEIISNSPIAPALYPTQVLTSFVPPERLTQLEEIAQSCLASLKNYYEDYPEDGGCDEGAQYWEHSVGHFFECGLWESFPEMKLFFMYSFIYKVHMTGNYYVNFADCAASLTPNASLIYLMGAATKRPKLLNFASFLFHSAKKETADLTLRDNMDFRAVLNAGIASPFIETYHGEFEHEPHELFDSLGVAIFRQGPFCVAAKGGHNGENHNHNDCGNVIVYADGKPILIDVGVGAYTKDTFSDRRYSIWTMQSSYHNLPEINGYMQGTGKEFAAEFTTSTTDKFLHLCSGAYPREAKVSLFFQGAKVNEDSVEITSTFDLLEDNSSVVLNYMLAKKPELNDCLARVNGYLLKLPKGNWSVETIEFGEDEKLSPVWGHCVYRLRGELEIPAKYFTVTTTIEADTKKKQVLEECPTMK